MKGLTISTGSVELPRASQPVACYSAAAAVAAAASCFAACPIYLFIRPSSARDSLLIAPIKINPHLKISSLARHRGCSRGGDGPSLPQPLPTALPCRLALADRRSSVRLGSALASE